MPESRYGVYLRPDPATCMVVSQVTGLLARQFGIVSASAFPPHVTLAGSIRTQSTPADLVRMLEDTLRPVRSFVVRNSGLVSSNGGWAYNINDNEEGEPNGQLCELAAVVLAAMGPVTLPNDDLHTAVIGPESFVAHLSLASHDLIERPDLKEEVGEFIRGIPLRPPVTFVANTVSLFETTSDGWRGEWWRSLRWRQIRSWSLEPA